MSRAGFVIGVALVLGGCEPSCEAVCNKTLACGMADAPRVSQAECEDACATRHALYDAWDDPDKQQAFVDHKRCLMDASCDEIEDGACYDPEIFEF